MADINLQSQRTSTYKGFLEFKDGSNYYRLKERQNASLGFTFSYSSHYSDSGFKTLDPTGYDHSFSCTIKVTADMMDVEQSSSGDAPTNTKTISYWIYKASKFEPVDIIFVAKQVAIGSSDTKPNIWYKFKVRLTSFGTGYSSTGGSQDWDLNGIITEINAIERNNSSSEPSATTNWQP